MSELDEVIEALERIAADETSEWGDASPDLLAALTTLRSMKARAVEGHTNSRKRWLHPDEVGDRGWMGYTTPAQAMSGDARFGYWLCIALAVFMGVVLDESTATYAFLAASLVIGALAPRSKP